MPEPRAIHIEDLQGLDTPELRKRLALALAAVRVASIEAGGVRRGRGAGELTTC